MNQNYLFRAGIAVIGLCATALTSCSSDSETVIADGTSDDALAASSKYVIAASVDNAASLVTADAIRSGAVSVKGNGVEVDDGAYWIFKDGKSLFRLTYNQGSAGIGSSYYLDANGRLQEHLVFDCQRFSTYGTYGDYVITASTGNTTVTDAAGNYAQGFLFNYLDGTTGDLSSRTVVGENFLGNGEKVCFAGFVEKNDRLYTSVIPMGMSKYGIAAHPEYVTDAALIAAADGGSASSSYVAGEIPSTQYPDSAFVAIYPSADFTVQPVIARTGKIGFASGRMRSQYYQTIWAADNGDIYVFSPGYGRLTTSDASLQRVSGQLPSGVVRIKAGDTDFDADYYVNIEELGNRHPLYRCWPISGDAFLVQFYTNGLTSKGENTLELGVFHGNSGTLTMVTGLPSTDVLTSFGTNPYAEDGVIYMPVVTSDGRNPAIYCIDAATAVATRGIDVEAESIKAIGKLTSRN
jgi:hypothetical protein